MSPNGESAAPILGSTVTTAAATLPPMSTFRGTAASVVAAGNNAAGGAPSPASIQQYNTHSPGGGGGNAPPTTVTPVAVANVTQQQQTSQTSTPDNIGKTMASVVTARVRIFILFNNMNKNYFSFNIVNNISLIYFRYIPRTSQYPVIVVIHRHQ